MSTPTSTPNPPNNPFLAENTTPPQFSETITPDPSATLDESDNAALSEELPPAYTPTPDPEQGESSVEFGPRRPFQQAPPPVQQQQTQLLSPHVASTTRSSSHGRSQSHSRTTLEQSLLGLLTGRPSSTEHGSVRSEVFTYPGNRRQVQQPAPAPVPVPVVTESRSTRIPAPPPRHPASSSTSLSSSASSNMSNISEFARDFYAAGPASNLVQPSASSSSTPAQPMYAPPPGAPPPPKSSNTPQGVPDEGRPTKTAVPGHPLLKDGQILIYPAGHMCEKCNNTGYKQNDPTNPCRKCWTKYAKPYSGAVLYTDWSSVNNSSNNGTSTFQRPLPNLRPAVAAVNTSVPPSCQRSAPQSAPSNLNPPNHRPRSRSQSHAMAPSPQPFHAPPPVPRIAVADPYFNPPPPGARVLPPGDERLGGQRCWKCGGAGVVPFFIFDEIPCSTCRGIGRVFVV